MDQGALSLNNFGLVMEKSMVPLEAVFLSEAEALRQHLRMEKDLTPSQRLHAVGDILAAAAALSQAGKMREAQVRHQIGLEEDWRRRMKEFIALHGEFR